MSIPAHCNALPAGWAVAAIGEVAELNPRGFDSEPLDTDPVSFVPMASVEACSGRIASPEVRAWGEVKKGYTRFQDADIIFAKITPCMENGKFAIASNLMGGRAAGSTEFHVLRPTAALNPKFLLHFVLQDQVRREARGSMKGAAGQLRVPVEFLRDLTVPIPPRPEQDRIVEAIDAHSSGMDSAVAALHRARANLKRYRAAVLKAACEGRLVPTEAELARQEGRDYEPAGTLLERILAERRARWEAEEVRKLRDQGKSPTHDNWKRRYKAPEAADTSDLDVPTLPEGWTWVTLGQLAWSVKDGPHYSPAYADEGVPFISGGNVRPEGVDFVRAKRITPELHRELSKRCKPEYGDILYTKGGTTGIARVNTYRQEFNVWVHVAVLKLVGLIDPFYVQHALNAPFCYAQAQRFTHGVGNQDLGLTRMVRIVLALPPLDEQRRAVREVERQLSTIDDLERTVAAGLQRAARLRQSILKRAFEGKLAPQDPTDEPAFALLERIGAELNAVRKVMRRTATKATS